MILSFNMAMNTSVDLFVKILNDDTPNEFFINLDSGSYIPDMNNRVIRDQFLNIVGQILIGDFRNNETDYGYFERL
jgi:hypothetical protein